MPESTVITVRAVLVWMLEQAMNRRSTSLQIASDPAQHNHIRIHHVGEALKARRSVCQFRSMIDDLDREQSASNTLTRIRPQGLLTVEGNHHGSNR